VPWPAVAATAVALLLLPVLAVVALRDDPAPEPTPSPTPLAVATPTPRPPTEPIDCPTVAPPDAPPGTEVYEGDVDGDGCASFVTRTGAIVVVPLIDGEPPRRYEIGLPGDLMVLGDWDCDGIDTPALYRPATGQLFKFFGWAEEDQPIITEPTGDERIGGRPQTVRDRTTGCDDVRIVDVPSIEA
jgi:hypothetical protein